MINIAQKGSENYFFINIPHYEQNVHDIHHV